MLHRGNWKTTLIIHSSEYSVFKLCLIWIKYSRCIIGLLLSFISMLHLTLLLPRLKLNQLNQDLILFNKVMQISVWPFTKIVGWFTEARERTASIIHSSEYWSWRYSLFLWIITDLTYSSLLIQASSYTCKILWFIHLNIKKLIKPKN